MIKLGLPAGIQTLFGLIFCQWAEAVALSEPLLLGDTNILVYGINQDFKFFKRSRNVLDHSNKQLITTSKNLFEFLAVVTRKSEYDLKTDLGLEILDNYSRHRGYLP